MATTAAELIRRVRRKVMDYPDRDVLTASLSSTGTTVTVADTDATSGPRYTPNGLIEVDYELMRVLTVSGGTTMTVLRGAQGSTAATHVTASPVLFDPAFSSMQILDAINDGLDALWPFFYQQVVDTSLSGTSGTFEYTIPTVASISAPIPAIRQVDLKPSGLTEWFTSQRYEIVRGATPALRFNGELGEGTAVRIHGYAPLPHLAIGDSTHAQLPYNADNLAVDWAVGSLLYTGESGRVRQDLGVIDSREQANQVGASLRIGREWERRFYQRASSLAMPPIARSLRVDL